MNPESMQALFKAVNAAVFSLSPNSTLTLVGDAPEWLVRLCPGLPLLERPVSPGSVFSFLENFLEEANDFWNGEKVGCRKSGLWSETDDSGQDHLLEASAVNTGEDKILIIAHDHFSFAEKMNLIQKGREIALDRTELQRMQAELHAILQAAARELAGP